MLQQLQRLVGESSIPESWKRNLTYALDTLPEQDISFLTEEHMVKVRQHIRFSEERAKLLTNAFAVIREDAEWRFLAWLWHCIIFRKPDFTPGEIMSWPLPLKASESEGSLPELFPIVILLSGYDHVMDIYRQVGNIPGDIQIDTLSKVNESMNLYAEENQGQEGLSLTSFNFLLLHFRGKLFSIGRLEFEMKPFGNYVQVYQKHDGEVIAFAQPGIRYRRDGQVDGTNDIFDERSWIATVQQSEDEVTGYPISEDGYAAKQTITIDKSQWSLVLKEGDDILNVHIPRKGELSFEACQDGYARAITFFQTCFPTKKFGALVCVSWLMNPKLRKLLKEPSNLITFQRHYNLFPLLADDKGVYKFVFRCDPCPVDQLPETTTLQKKLKQYMQAGGFIERVGGFVILSSIRRPQHEA